jgi:hypothetical protein
MPRHRSSDEPTPPSLPEEIAALGYEEALEALEEIIDRIEQGVVARWCWRPPNSRSAS